MSKHQAQKFIDVIDGTEAWLNQHFSDPGLSDPIKGLAKDLRRYLRHSRRYLKREIQRERLNWGELDRKIRKIEEAMVKLWQARRGDQ